MLYSGRINRVKQYEIGSNFNKDDLHKNIAINKRRERVKACRMHMSLVAARSGHDIAQ